jgi:molybdopterin-guanine dinucleotide biosynthesis protein A
MLSIAILAGGKSRRMGHDKALMPFLGRPLIWRIIERLRSLSDDMFVMTTRPADYAFLDVPIHSDLVKPGQGSLLGLYNSLLTARKPFVAIVGCDMPFASPALFAYERDVMDATDADVVIPSTSVGLEPLHAVYRRATCLPVLEAALEAGERKIIAWFPEVKVHILPDEVTASYDQHQLTFWNLNTPEEYRQAEARARLEESF